MDRGKHDDLNVLDKINYGRAKEMMGDPDLLKILADIRADVAKSETARMLQEADMQVDDSAPETFDEMLDTSTGTVSQRLKKLYLKTGDPEQAQKVLTMIGAKHFREVIRHTAGRLRKKTDEKTLREGKNTNYFIANPSDANLLDFALNKATINEMAHGLMAAGCVVMGATTGFDTTVVTFFLLNTYCSLAQRLTRAEIATVINRKLSRKKGLSLDGYVDELNLRLPQPRG